jgi:hypothetical protein
MHNLALRDGIRLLRALKWRTLSQLGMRNFRIPIEFGVRGPHVLTRLSSTSSSSYHSMTQIQPLLEARLQQRVKELEDEVASLKARLRQYERNENPHVAQKPTLSHSDSSTPPTSLVTTIPLKHLHSPALPSGSCTAPSSRSGTASTYGVLVFNLKDASTASVKSPENKGDKALDEIRVNLDTWCSQPASDLYASRSNERTVRDPDTTLRPSIHDLGKAWAQSVATSIDEMKQEEILVRVEIFYFLMFILVAERLHVITEEGAFELLSIMVATDSRPTWLRRLLTSIGWINDDVIVELCKKGWPAAVATTAMSLGKIVHQSSR